MDQRRGVAHIRGLELRTGNLLVQIVAGGIQQAATLQPVAEHLGGGGLAGAGRAGEEQNLAVAAGGQAALAAGAVHLHQINDALQLRLDRLATPEFLLHLRGQVCSGLQGVFLALQGDGCQGLRSGQLHAAVLFSLLAQHLHVAQDVAVAEPAMAAAELVEVRQNVVVRVILDVDVVLVQLSFEDIAVVIAELVGLVQLHNLRTAGEVQVLAQRAQAALSLLAVVLFVQHDNGQAAAGDLAGNQLGHAIPAGLRRNEQRVIAVIQDPAVITGGEAISSHIGLAHGEQFTEGVHRVLAVHGAQWQHRQQALAVKAWAAHIFVEGQTGVDVALAGSQVGCADVAQFLGLGQQHHAVVLAVQLHVIQHAQVRGGTQFRLGAAHLHKGHHKAWHILQRVALIVRFDPPQLGTGDGIRIVGRPNSHK